MVTTVLFCVLLLIVNTLATENVTAKTYFLNTSLPANEYLAEICHDYKDAAVSAFSVMLDMLPKAMQPSAEKLAMEYWLSGSVKEPYRSEIIYFSNCSGLSIQSIMTVNIIYDLTAFCTSIVCVTTDGKILHARNQDFPTVLRNDTVNMVYVDADNNTLYEATTFCGYVGVPTGIKYDGFSITIDARYDIYGLQNWIDIGKTYFPAGWLVRECLMHDKDFDACVERLSTTQIQAPIYYIIAGTDGSMNGAVVTRNQTQVNGPNNSDQVWYLNDTENNPYKWYIVETNYDHWAPAGDTRREHAVKMMNSIGQENIDFDTLFQVLSTPPVLASDTVYTTLMQPSNRTYYNTTVRYDTTKLAE
mmetsp:Transcript_15026/g.13492  ORF Transcript_15026/g.13492 Transcript_15026/m.13492 type:complete len:360 (-) Transcript_15026:39-1118(-)